jgi:hypothetical protein
VGDEFCTQMAHSGNSLLSLPRSPFFITKRHADMNRD